MAHKKTRKIDWKIPKSYKQVLSQEEYAKVLQIALNYLEKKGEIKKVKDGVVYFKHTESNSEEEVQIFLDNLVRKCKASENEIWEDIVAQHFASLQLNISAYKYIFKDFEFAENLLRVLVKPKDVAMLNSQDFVCREDFPETYTFLVIDFDDKFTFVKREDIHEWETSEDDLFTIAVRNVSRENVEVSTQQIENKFVFYSIFSGDFSASYILNPEKNLPIAVGDKGAVVTIPTKGVAFIYPIIDAEVLDFLPNLAPLVLGFYYEDPYPITNHFYWYYEGSFEVFPYHNTKEGYRAIGLPEKLVYLLGNDTDEDED